MSYFNPFHFLSPEKQRKSRNAGFLAPFLRKFTHTWHNTVSYLIIELMLAGDKCGRIYYVKIFYMLFVL